MCRINLGSESGDSDSGYSDLPDLITDDEEAERRELVASTEVANEAAPANGINDGRIMHEALDILHTVSANDDRFTYVEQITATAFSMISEYCMVMFDVNNDEVKVTFVLHP